MAMGAKPLRDLVDLVGIEPTTSSMPWKRAPSCATGPLEGTLTTCAEDLIHFRPVRGDSQRIELVLDGEPGRRSQMVNFDAKI